MGGIDGGWHEAIKQEVERHRNATKPNVEVADAGTLQDTSPSLQAGYPSTVRSTRLEERLQIVFILRSVQWNDWEDGRLWIRTERQQSSLIHQR